MDGWMDGWRTGGDLIMNYFSHKQFFQPHTTLSSPLSLCPMLHFICPTKHHTQPKTRWNLSSNNPKAVRGFAFSCAVRRCRRREWQWGGFRQPHWCLHWISIPLSSRHALHRWLMNNLMNEISLHTKITGHVLQIIFESLRCKFVPDFRFRYHGGNSTKY